MKLSRINQLLDRKLPPSIHGTNYETVEASFVGSEVNYERLVGLVAQNLRIVKSFMHGLFYVRLCPF